MAEEKKSIIEKIPKLSFVLIIISFVYVIISIIQFGFAYYDLSQLITNIVIGGAFTVLAYIYWYFRSNDENFKEIECDFKSFDKKLTELEYKVIELNRK